MLITIQKNEGSERTVVLKHPVLIHDFLKPQQLIHPNTYTYERNLPFFQLVSV